MASGAWALARMRVAQMWASEPGPATAAYVLACVEKLRPHLSLVSCRLFVLRAFTLEPVVPLVRAAAAVAGIDLTVRLGEFNAYVQEIVSPDSALYAFRPDVAILAVQTRDVAPELAVRFGDLSTDEVNAVIERVSAEMTSLIRTFRGNSSASLVLHGLEVPAWPAAGLWDAQQPEGQREAIRRINRRIQEAARAVPGVYVLDYDELVARVGRTRWHDLRKWLTMRMPIAAPALGSLADEWLRFICPLAGRTCKVVVTDLDNTLWGGVVGEDGFQGIQLGPEYPGAIYQAVQRALLDIRQRGFLLAVCSKNNPPEAMEVLEKHPGMLLRPGDIAALRINWQDKVQNLREIAAELNLGLDAMAFLDDNPAERERVRLELPEVTVVELPADPMAFAAALRQHPALERLAVSAEDRERSRYYGEQRERTALQQSAGSVQEFLRSLDQRMVIAAVNPSTRARVAQLTQKTNQFNLTTRRYSEQEIADMAARSGYEVFSVQVADRFGDNGIVGVMITRREDGVGVIDTFLLSCRVIGRTVETAMLAFLLERARARGDHRLEGWFYPTKKNAPASEFYATHGFVLEETVEQGSRWSLAVATAGLRCPDWITLSINAEPNS